MPDTIEKKCPKCLKVSVGTKSIEKYHGFRKIGIKQIPQSLCRECRSLHKKQSTKFKKNNPKLANTDLRKQLGKRKDRKSIPTNSKKLTSKQLETIWEKLTKEQKANYKKAHKIYTKYKEIEKTKTIKVTKRKHLKKSKALSNFKKDLTVFQKATMNKPKKVIPV